VLQEGTILYNRKLNKVKVLSIDHIHIKVNVERIVQVSYNNGKKQEQQLFNDKETYPITYIGTHLFYAPTDIELDYRSLIDNPKYLFNKEQILDFHDLKHNKLLKNILSEAPNHPINGLALEQIITNYYDINIQKNQENQFKALTENKIDYFGRMDFSTLYYKAKYKNIYSGSYYDRIYLSKNGSYDFEDTKVIDWRSPIGSFYYNNESTNFVYGDTYEYKLLLKRSFQFKPFKFQDLFVEGKGLYSEGSVDEFLIKLLFEKKSLHKPTDIIQSIQSNQNKIIRSDPDSNLIVQGCAGSGKTMILLHRLSYLLYNKHIRKAQNVIIITPSEFFNTFYGDLASYLELDEVFTTTMNGFYQYCITQYENDFYIKSIKLSVTLKKSIEKMAFDSIQIVSNSVTALSFDDNTFNTIQSLYSNVVNLILTESLVHKIEELTKRLDIDFNRNQNESNSEKIKSLHAITEKSLLFKNNVTVQSPLIQK